MRPVRSHRTRREAGSGERKRGALLRVPDSQLRALIGPAPRDQRAGDDERVERFRLAQPAELQHQAHRGIGGRGPKRRRGGKETSVQTHRLAQWSKAAPRHWERGSPGRLRCHAPAAAAIAQFCRGGRLRNGSPCCRGTIQSPLAIISRATWPRRGSSPLGSGSPSRGQ